jgi:polysaccharide deacetylase family protein (PEP-CTERM system associated)
MTARRGPRCTNAFTVDVEDWYQTSDFNFPPAGWGHYEDRVERNTLKILDLLDDYNVKGTFFVLGCVAAKFPRLVAEIAARGHEIGSHGGWHRPLTRLSWDETVADLRFGKAVLEGITGRPVRSFRAPSWSLEPATFRVLAFLSAEGITCDSSLQPFRTPLSGVPRAPHLPFRPSLGGIALNLVEYPSTVLKWKGMCVPFSGGLYLRTLPSSLVHWALRKVNEQRSGMVYVHPWDVDPGQPRLPCSPVIRFVHYAGLGSTEAKIRALLRHFSFVPLQDLVRQVRSFPIIPLDPKGEETA